MHLGLTVHFVGDTTTPPITPRDLCLVNSGTGETRFAYHVAAAAKEAGARVATITAHPHARIARMADIVVHVPAPTKGEVFGPRASRQPAGSLFEQACFVILEAIVLMLLDRLEVSPSSMLKRHANIE
jgi:6-phospho-3-hexuloisomerase